MKRFTAAAVAPATALSLSAGAASAQSLGFGSSAADSEIRNDVGEWQRENPSSDAPNTTLDTIFGIGAVLALVVGIYSLVLQAGVQLPQLGR